MSVSMACTLPGLREIWESTTKDEHKIWVRSMLQRELSDLQRKPSAL